MVATAIKLSISPCAAATRLFAMPYAVCAESRPQSRPANVLAMGQAGMRFCHADRGAGVGVRRVSACPVYLTSDLFRWWRDVTCGLIDNAFRRPRISTSTASGRLHAARRVRRNRVEWRLTLLGTTALKPTYEGLPSQSRACCRVELAARRTPSKQARERTPRDDAGGRRPHVERFTGSSARRAKYAREMVRTVRRALEISQAGHSPRQGALLDVGLGNGAVVKHGFARNSMTHPSLKYFTPTTGHWMYSESGGPSDPFDDGRGAA